MASISTLKVNIEAEMGDSWNQCMQSLQQLEHMLRTAQLEAAPKPSLLAVASVAAVASASTKPLSRRSLLGLFWRRTA